MDITDAYCGPISLLSSLFLIITILTTWNTLNKKENRKIMFYVFWMSCSDLAFSVRLCTRFIYQFPETDSIMCILDGFFGVFFTVSIASWYFLLTLQIFMTLRHKTPPHCIENRYVNHAYVWG